MTAATDKQARVSATEFEALHRTVSNWGRWGEADQRGTLNYIRPEHITAAAKLVREGLSVSLSWPLNTSPAAHNPIPADHHMTALPSGDGEPGPLRFARDYIGIDYHGDTHSHVDALCHVAYHGLLYNGVPASTVTSAGATAESVETIAEGLIGRGVLLDIPRLSGRPWLEPGEHVLRKELEAAESEQGVVVGKGDILLVRTGHGRRLRELGPWKTATAKSGLHPTAATFLAERKVAALGSEGNSDTAPSTTEGVDFPIHVLAINAMGVHLLDYLELDALRQACERLGRWDFFVVAAPLRIVGGTGSPLNAIAIF